jgi:hypothetical protein
MVDICQPQGFTILLMVYNLGASGFMGEECLQYDSPKPLHNAQIGGRFSLTRNELMDAEDESDTT